MLTKSHVRGFLAILKNIVLKIPWVTFEDDYVALGDEQMSAASVTVFWGFFVPLLLTVVFGALFQNQAPGMTPYLIVYALGWIVCHLIIILRRAYNKLPEGDLEEQETSSKVKRKRDFRHLADGEMVEVVEDDNGPIELEKPKRNG